MKIQLVCSSCQAPAFVMDPVATKRGQPVYTDVHGRPARWRCACGQTGLEAAKDPWVADNEVQLANLDPNDIFARWAGEVQKMRRDYEQKLYLETRSAFQRGRQSAQSEATSDWTWRGGKFCPPTPSGAQSAPEGA